nr:MFS transporter [Microbacterium hominis]
MLFAFSLRSAVASLSPLFGLIAADFPVSSAVIGLIGTAPAVCYAVFGLLTPALERRFGLEKLASAAMAVVAIGLIARSLAPNSGLLLAGTALVFAGVGSGNVLLPPLVKRYFPDRIGLMTSLFSTTMAVASFVPPLLAVPIADATSWRLSLGLWAVFAAAAIIPWVTMILRRPIAGPVDDDDIEQPSPRVFGRLWRLPTAWALMFGLVVSSSIAYTSFAWLPTLLIDTAGVTPAGAGALLALFASMGLPCSVLVPLLVTRWNATLPLFLTAFAAGVVAVAGLIVAPAAAPWLWVTLLGIATLTFPLVLVLIGLRTRTHEGSVALSGFVQSIGYAVTAIVPLGFGLLHEATGSWNGPLLVLAVVITAAVPAGVVAARPRTIEDEWELRRGTW